MSCLLNILEEYNLPLGEECFITQMPIHGYELVGHDRQVEEDGHQTDAQND